LAKAKRNETKKYIGLSIITGVITLIAAIAKGFTSAKLAAITERAVLAQVGINPDIANYEGTLNLCQMADNVMMCIIVGGSILFIVSLVFLAISIAKKEFNLGGK
jgi:glucose uptake protein GlcU